MDNTGPLLQPVPSPRVLLENAWANFSSSLCLSFYATETEKPEKPRRRDEARERERDRVSRPRKESGVDIARGGGGDTRLVETSRERLEGGKKKEKEKEKGKKRG